MKSLINTVDGLPCSADGWRAYLITSWTQEGIASAIKKFGVNDMAALRLPMQTHKGTTGTYGDTWYSVVIIAGEAWTRSNMLAEVYDRYGMKRHVWTEDA